jgi:predicted  nucleic acid-binding Zn-ribbon protein
MNNKITTIEGLAVLVQGEFAEMGKRFDRLEQRMDRLEQRMDRLEQRMDKIEQRMDKAELRMDGFVTKDDFKEGVAGIRREMRNLDMRTPVIDLQIRVKKAEERLDVAGF